MYSYEFVFNHLYLTNLSFLPVSIFLFRFKSEILIFNEDILRTSPLTYSHWQLM